MSDELEIPVTGEFPKELPVLPLKGTVVFPGAMAPLSIGEQRSIRLIDEVVDSASRMVVLVTSRNPDATEPGPELLHDVGTVAVVQKMLKVPDGTLRILAQGTDRVRVGPYTATEPYLVAQIAAMPEPGPAPAWLNRRGQCCHRGYAGRPDEAPASAADTVRESP